jgi:hypothetical protein
MRLFGFALAAGFLLAASLPAAAEVFETHRYGHWIAIEGTTQNGSRVCGVSTRSAADTPAAYVGVKFFPDRGQLDVHMAKPSWSIPGGTSLPVEIEFDGSSTPWATGHAAGNGGMVTLSVNPRRAGEFLAEFSAASRGTIRFGGDEAPWAVDLSGSGAAVQAMADCIQRAGGSRGGGAAATQPHWAAPSRTPPAAKPPAQRPQPGGVSVLGPERRT